jgi:peptide/nickel transport system substrate-binding protein
MPTVSGDGLTWTFHIRPNIHYAPPLGRIEVTAQDFVRALERAACRKCSRGGYSFYFSGIKGFDVFAEHRARSISGVRAPDDHTLVVDLTHPEGDLGNLFALAATAPIPPSPARPGARLGVATGHDAGYGRYLVSTGPYMIAGSQRLDFSNLDHEQPVAGYRPGRSIRLVRNPSWRRATDPLRGAYVDRIDAVIGQSEVLAARAVEEGDADVVFTNIHSDPLAIVRRYLGSPRLRGRVHTASVNEIDFINLNVAEPPFDDVHVRRAVNYVIDKQRVLRLLEMPGVLPGSVFGKVAGHLAPDSLEDGLLLNFNPYGSVGNHGDVVAARREMAKSRYDVDHDGICDASACRSVWVPSFESRMSADAGRVIARNLRTIGLRLRLQRVGVNGFFSTVADPRRHVPMGLGNGWLSDFPNGSQYFTDLFHGGPGDLGANDSLVGATREQLRQWGYRTTAVPNVDDRIDQCEKEAGRLQAQCWAQLDQYMMQDVVPAVPLFFAEIRRIVSDRVARMSFDQFTSMPALDQIALRAGNR